MAGRTTHGDGFHGSSAWLAANMLPLLSCIEHSHTLPDRPCESFQPFLDIDSLTPIRFFWTTLFLMLLRPCLLMSIGFLALAHTVLSTVCRRLCTGRGSESQHSDRLQLCISLSFVIHCHSDATRPMSAELQPALGIAAPCGLCSPNILPHHQTLAGLDYC